MHRPRYLSPDLDLKEVIFRARPRKPLILRDRLECGLCAERERERESRYGRDCEILKWYSMADSNKYKRFYFIMY